jgi:hypothetical protein
VQTGKKCVQCSTLNEPGAVYCRSCHKYLLGRSSGREKKRTIWGIEGTPEDMVRPVSPPAECDSGRVRLVAVCPECGNKNAADEGVLPVSCSVCGYLFQMWLDRVITETEADQQPAVRELPEIPKQEPHSGSVPEGKKGKGPLARGGHDTSSLRFSVISSSGIMPEIMKESGNVIGRNGTAFRMIKTDQEVRVWHNRGGWYICADHGEPMYNGEIMTVGAEKRIFPGDQIMIGKERLSAEIY